MQGALQITLAEAGGDLAPRLVLPPALPLDPLMRGKTPEEVVELLPRLFNLCAASQALALRLALDLPADTGAMAVLRRDVLRDHLFRLLVNWPRHLGLPPRALPPGWDQDAAVVERSVYGSARPVVLDDWLARGEGVAPVIAALAEGFAPGEGVGPDLPLWSPEGEGPCENSLAARHADHPILQRLAVRGGRGPLWRAMGRVLDVAACLDDTLPQPRRIAPGRAVAPASRGMFRVSVRVLGGRVLGVDRRTPTDDMLPLALGAALARLPAAKRALAPLLVDLFDPCMAVQIREGGDA